LSTGLLAVAAVHLFHCLGVNSGPDIGCTHQTDPLPLGRPFPELRSQSDVAILSLDETASSLSPSVLYYMRDPADGGGYAPDPESPLAWVSARHLGECDFSFRPDGGTPQNIPRDAGPVRLTGLSGGDVNLTFLENRYLADRAPSRDEAVAGTLISFTLLQFQGRLGTLSLPVSVTLPIPGQVEILEPQEGATASRSQPLRISWVTRGGGFLTLSLQGEQGTLGCRVLDQGEFGEFQVPPALLSDDLRFRPGEILTLELCRMNAASPASSDASRLGQVGLSDLVALATSRRTVRIALGP
jgi:hypothetical protein